MHVAQGDACNTMGILLIQGEERMNVAQTWVLTLVNHTCIGSTSKFFLTSKISALSHSQDFNLAFPLMLIINPILHSVDVCSLTWMLTEVAVILKHLVGPICVRVAAEQYSVVLCLSVSRCA